METIGTQQMWSWLDGADKSEHATNGKVRGGDGHVVRNYLDLAYKVSELQFRNRDFVLLFRGQGRDHRNRQSRTSLRPSILRDPASGKASPDLTQRRYARLATAERLLVEHYDFIGRERIRRQQLLRWSILQHYEVCETPLLDVSQSLRIAASFASHAGDEVAFIYALGVPNISGAITASAEASLATLRLASVCPPDAVRPHVQEGYLLSEYPELSSTDQQAQYENYEIDFGLRLVAKFRFEPEAFWKGSPGFPIVPTTALYPKQDPLLELVRWIGARLPPLPAG